MSYIAIIPARGGSKRIPHKNIKYFCGKPIIAWSIQTALSSKLFDRVIVSTDDDDIAEAFARIECHYFINKGFFESDSWLLDNVYKIEHIPTYIVQGRYDVVCPLTSAWELHKKLPKAKFDIIQDAGHSMLEIGIQKKLIEITDSI